MDWGFATYIQPSADAALIREYLSTAGDHSCKQKSLYQQVFVLVEAISLATVEKRGASSPVGLFGERPGY